MSQTDKTFYWMAYLALGVLSLGIFTSVSFSALAHILLFPSGLFFLIKNFKEKSFKPKPSLYALLVLTLISITSVLVNLDIVENPLRNILKTKYFIIGILGAYAFHFLKKNWLNPKRTKILVNLFLLSAAVASLSGLIGLWSGFNPLKFKPPCHPQRACGLYGMYMTYGYGISLFTVIATGLIVYRERFKAYFTPWLLYVSLGINLIGLFYSFARGGWIGFAFGVPFLFLKNHTKKFGIGLGIIALLGGGVFLGSEKVRNTFMNRGESNQQRIHFFQAAYAAFKEKPLLGFGYRNFVANSIDIKKRHGIGSQHFAGHAHNNALEHLASTGILGFLAFIVFCLLWLKEAYEEPILFAFVMSFLMSGLFQYTFGDGENLFLIFGIFSLFS
ncbi:MAG: O-antigen ligase family protein [Halobacteriovoraceae bacterium]|nr:O-antigen ligase family protein [Halobacteriovoraceae bacterium]